MCNIISRNCFTIELSTANVSLFCTILWSCLPRAMQKLLRWRGVVRRNCSTPRGGGREPSTSFKRTPPPKSGQSGAPLSLIPRGLAFPVPATAFCWAARGLIWSSWRPSACLWGLSLTAKGSPMWRATRAIRVLTDLREFGPSPLCVLGQLRAESWDSFRLLDHSWLNKTHVGICIFKRGASSTL